MFAQEYRAGQVWERLDGDHRGHRLLITRVDGRSVKGRSVGPLAKAPNRGNEKHKITIPFDELHRHYALFRDIKRQQPREYVMAEPGEINLILDEPAQEVPDFEIPAAAKPETPNGLTVHGTPRKRKPVTRHSAKLSEDQIAEVLRLYEDWSISVEEILKTYDLTPGLMYRLLKIHNVPSRAARGYTTGYYSRRPKEEVEKAIESNVSAIVLPTPPAAQAVQQRAWMISYVVTRSTIVPAPSLDEALRRVRETHGEDIDITSVQRT